MEPEKNQKQFKKVDFIFYNHPCVLDKYVVAVTIDSLSYKDNGKKNRKTLHLTLKNVGSYINMSTYQYKQARFYCIVNAIGNVNHGLNKRIVAIIRIEIWVYSIF